MRIEDGDSPYGRFVSPSGREVKTFSQLCPLPPENEVKVHFLGSLSSAVGVLESFDDQKRGILRSIRFEGVLDFAKVPSFDLYYYLWVMSKMDSSTCSIVIKGTEVLPIRDADVGHILGIPWYGVEMIVEPETTKEIVSSILKILRSADSSANLTTCHFEEVLKKNYDSKMSNAEVDAFKIAVVVFTMSNFLATAGNPSIVPLGLLKFLLVPEDIHLFNWSLLVRRYLVSWSHLLQQQLRLDLPNITIGGCFLVPMIAFLDNLMLGSATMLHYQFPRSSVYNSLILKRMIDADTKINSETEGRVFGKAELKSANVVCYGRWIVEFKEEKPFFTKKRKYSRFMNEEFEQKTAHKGLVSKLVLLAANKTISREIMRTTGLCKNQISSKSAGSYERYEGETIKRMDAFFEELRIADKTSLDKCLKMFKSLKDGSVMLSHKTWFCHIEPYEIKISAPSLATQLVDGGRYCEEVCDAILRDQIQVEDIVFSGKRKRERHLLSASFLHKYRQRDPKSGLEQLRIFFIGDHVKYEVTKCIQINMAVSSRRKWTCYSWNMSERLLSVLDPMLMRGPVSVIKQTHEHLVEEINKALFSCLEEFFPQYCIQQSEWRTIYRNDISDKCKWCDTGLYSMHYALTFNTDIITEEISWEDDFMGRWRSIWRILAMDGNIGEKPESFFDIKFGY